MLITGIWHVNQRVFDYLIFLSFSEFSSSDEMVQFWHLLLLFEWFPIVSFSSSAPLLCDCFSQLFSSFQGYESRVLILSEMEKDTFYMWSLESLSAKSELKKCTVILNILINTFIRVVMIWLIFKRSVCYGQGNFWGSGATQANRKFYEFQLDHLNCNSTVLISIQAIHLRVNC